MAEYENRPIKEGINYSREHPLKEFLLLAVAAIGILVAAIFLLSLFAERLAPMVSFQLEERIAERVGSGLDAKPLTQLQRKTRAYLQSVVDGLVEEQQLPDGLTLTVHYVDNAEVNALATLGGNIVVFRGLLDSMDSENALAMVLAHEIAHILHRDPIIAMGRGLTISLALASISGLSGSGMDWLIQQVGSVTLLRFSREQERDADITGLKLLQERYGHVGGASRLFEIMAAQKGVEAPAFLSTHPLNQERIQSIRQFEQEHWSSGPLTPLPGAIFSESRGGD